MLMCRNVVRMLGKPGRAGAKWEVRLANNGIPFVTDGMTRKWCMSYFQESEHVVAPAVAPLNLDLSSIIENEGEGEGATAHNMPTSRRAASVEGSECSSRLGLSVLGDGVQTSNSLNP